MKVTYPAAVVLRANKSPAADAEYPSTPGYKVAGTSKQAAETVAPTASHLRALVLAQFAGKPDGCTADEIATILNLSVLSVRPRVSELHRMGEIEPTGARRQNASRLSASVWRLASPLPRHPSAIDEATS
jgi:hypothetical protein